MVNFQHFSLIFNQNKMSQIFFKFFLYLQISYFTENFQHFFLTCYRQIVIKNIDNVPYSHSISLTFFKIINLKKNNNSLASFSFILKCWQHCLLLLLFVVVLLLLVLLVVETFPECRVCVFFLLSNSSIAFPSTCCRVLHLPQFRQLTNVCHFIRISPYRQKGKTIPSKKDRERGRESENKQANYEGY